MMDWLLAYLTYGVFLPASLLCMVPVRKYLKWHMSFSRFLFHSLGVMLLLITGLCYLDVMGGMDRNLLFGTVLALCAVYYLLSFRGKKAVLCYLFSFIVCILSFATLLSYIWDAWRNPTGSAAAATLEGGFSQWVAMMLLCLFFVPLFWRKLEWLIDHYLDGRIFVYMTVPSLVITLCNLLMIPVDFSNLFVGRLFYLTLMVVAVLLALFVVLQITFYLLARTLHDRSASEQKQQLMAMQLHQQEIQREYLAETHRLRHDFKHSVVALSALLKEEKYGEARDYLSQYSGTLETDRRHLDLCAQPALNALLNEYLQRAEDLSIRFHHQIRLPNVLNIEEPQLCVLVGNLLDNAIRACEKLPPERREMKLLLDTEGQSQLYLLLQNSYDGKLKWKDSAAPQLPSGHYGISSVQAIAEQHQGVARFHTEGTTFRAEIMLTLGQ